jgi:hypothetical protein
MEVATFDMMAACWYLKAFKDGVNCEKQLELLITITEDPERLLIFFNDGEMLPTELITELVDILGSQENHPSLQFKCILLFRNIVKDESIRIHLHEPFRLSSTLPNVIQIHNSSSELRQEALILLQKVTYGQRMSINDNYVQDLFDFLVKQITVSVSVCDVTLPCLGIRVLDVQSYILTLDKRMSLLSLPIIIFSLSLIASLGIKEKFATFKKTPKPLPLSRLYSTLYGWAIPRHCGVL